MADISRTNMLGFGFSWNMLGRSPPRRYPQRVDSAADALLAKKVPFLLTTGYDQATLPEWFAPVRRLEEPVETCVILRELGRLLST